MKKVIVLTGSVLLLAAFSLKKDPPAGRAGKSFIPSGTVSINDTLFVDETEVSNLSWKEFVASVEQKYGKESVEYRSALPDTLVWRNKNAYNEPYVNYYYSHVAYRDYPVVGISYEQVVRFCKWRTERVHIFMEIKEGKRKAENLNKEYTGKLKIEYRLPTKQEWEAMALPGLDKTKIKESQKNQHKYNVVNTTSIASSTSDNADVTAPVYSYWPNKLGVYNLIGNVSEMVAEKGIAKGGSWTTHLDNLSIWNDEVIEKPNAWTGFRCVCVMKSSEISS